MTDCKPIPSETVWRVCPYIYSRDLRDCERCPPCMNDHEHGPFQKGCYALAEEAARKVMESMDA